MKRRNVQTYGPRDGRIDRPSYSGASSHLKNWNFLSAVIFAMHLELIVGGDIAKSTNQDITIIFVRLFSLFFPRLKVGK